MDTSTESFHLGCIVCGPSTCAPVNHEIQDVIIIKVSRSRSAEKDEKFENIQHCHDI
jgi:hypothetical protein